MYWSDWETPLGAMLGVVDERGRLQRLDFLGDERETAEARLRETGFAEVATRKPRRLAEVQKQVGQYFAGRRERFDLELAWDGTDFQKRVWRALRRTRYGRTLNYPELARRAGHEGAVRAAGLANSHNPISLVVPCHRVVGVDGALRGYGGGLPRKLALLEFEAGGGEADPAELLARAQRLLKVEGRLTLHSFAP